MKKLNGESMDITAENIKAMEQFFPEAFEEGKIDFDVLRQLLGDFVDDAQEKYSFKWNGKGKALRLSQTPSMGTLRPCREESKDWDNTENLYIEGDNLEVLKLLQKSYYGKVKMIYIDPPYNTGNDFVYKDNFRDNIQNYREITGQVDGEGNKNSTNTEASGRFHTDWLNMMYPRLRLARNLLSDDGVIFISIDDNEQGNLKKICDEVFGEDSFVNNFAWVCNITGRQIAGYGAAKTWESILVYAKNVKNFESLIANIDFVKKYLPDAYKGFNRDIRKDDIGEFAIGDTLYNHNRKFNEETRPNLVFSIFYNPVTDEIITGDIGNQIEGFIELLPHKNGDGVHKYHAWRWSKEKVAKESYNLIVLQTSNGGHEIYTRIRDFATTLLKDIITNISNGDSELQTIFDNKKFFDYPKSTLLLKLLINSMECKDMTVLDFFSGSATTAHAVMQLNAEDGGKRRFIMVQLPEATDEKSDAYKSGYKNICEIGKERIRRAGDKIKTEVGDKAKDLDIGFKVFKLDSSNLQKWNPQPENIVENIQLFADNFLPDRSEQDVLYEIILKMGLDLSCPIEEVETVGENIYIIGDGALMICLGEDITTAVADQMVKLHQEYDSELWQVVFRDTGFASDMDKTNIKEILKSAGLAEDSFVCV